MEDEDKTKDQLIAELKELRARVSELEKYEIHHKRIEETLKQSENNLKTIFNSLESGIIIIDRDSLSIIEVNDKAANMIGLDKNSIIGQICHSFICQCEADQCPIKDLKQTFDQSERQLVTADGKKRDILKTVVQIKFGNRDCYLENFIDITERKQAEEALKRSTFLLNETQRIAKLGGWEYDVVNQRNYWTNQVYDIYGVSLDYDINDLAKIASFFPSKNRKIILKSFQDAIDKGKSCDIEVEFINAQRNNLWVRNIIEPIFEDGKVVKIRGNFQDITDRKRMEQQLEDAFKFNQMIIDTSPVGVWLYEESGQTIMVNPAGIDLAGGTAEQLLSLNFRELESWKKTGVFDAAEQALLSGTLVRKEIHGINILGTEVWYEALLTPIQFKGKKHLLLMTYDIKELKHTEEALRKSQAQLSNAMEIAKLGYWEYDVAENLFTFNDQFYAMLRTTAEQVGGYKISSERYVELFLHPEDKPMVLFHMKKVHETTALDYSRQLEHRIIYGDGQTGYLSVRCYIIKDENGHTINTYGVNQDITDRKRAEQDRTRLETQLRRSQKLETIGTLAGGIAHDFNNILTPILGYADMALCCLHSSNPLYEDLSEIVKGANRAKDLVAQILTFSRQMEQERKPIYIHLIVKEALKLLRPSIPSTIEISQRIDDSCEKVLADPSQIHQVIVNLCTNAFQSMEQKGGLLTIELKQLKVDAATAKFHSNLSEKEYVRLTVSDTGIGMDEATIDRIFEPFFTTKAVDKGTGMGLSVVHGIVRSHHGDISITSEVGKGSTFHVYFPVLAAEKEIDKKEVKKIQGGEESIFIVDDEQPVANVIKKMLERLGYKITVRNSCVEALKDFRLKSEEYDLMITDLTMPNMTGLDLAKQLHKIKPELPIILMTGYGESVSREIQKHYGIHHIIGKPIELRDLASIIRETLDK